MNMKKKKKNVSIHHRCGSNKKQKGIATVLFVVLVGLALTATALGIMHSIRSTQERHVAVNAVTHAQTGVWVGAEAFRQYLLSLDDAALLALTGDLSIAMESGTYGNITAKNITSVEEAPNTGRFRVSANIVNIHAAARSSSSLGVVFDVTTSQPPASSGPFSSINFNDDLVLGGGVRLFDSSGVAMDLNVNGDVTIAGASTNPLSAIQSTGKVNIRNNITVESIYSNDDVYIEDVVVNTVKTLGNFESRNGARAQTVRVNGNAIIGSAGRIEEAFAHGNIAITGADNVIGQGYFKAGGNITISAGPVDRVHAIGSISSTTWNPVYEMRSMADITCVTPWIPPANWTVRSANGNLINCPNPATNPGATSGATNVITLEAPLTPYSFQTEVVDVWQLKSDANYVVEYDAVKDAIKVTVNNVNGLTDGASYYIGNYGTNGWYDPPGPLPAYGYMNYLCDDVVSGVCTLPAIPRSPFCLGYSVLSSCISMSADKKTFNINPMTAPGIIFFDGNVNIGTGHGASTYLVGGNISGNFYSASANYSGFNETCLALGANVIDKDNNGLPARYKERFENFYPKNLCDKTNNKYLPIPTGNIGLAAGGYVGGNYVGGNINLGGDSIVYGAVLAGNVVQTTDEVHIYGYVSAAGLGTRGVLDNRITSNTTIDLSLGNDDYDPDNIPPMGNSPSPPGGGGQSSSSRLLWAKYL